MLPHPPSVTETELASSLFDGPIPGLYSSRERSIVTKGETLAVEDVNGKVFIQRSKSFSALPSCGPCQEGDYYNIGKKCSKVANIDDREKTRLAYHNSKTFRY